MKKDEATPASPDPWRDKLLAALKKERPSKRRLGFWLGLALLVGLGVLVWLLLPRESLPLPPVVAFDVLARPGEPAHVRAVFDRHDMKAIPPLTGREIVFQQSRVPAPGQEFLLHTAKVEKDKWGRGELKFSGDYLQAAYEARVPGRDRQEGVKDQAHVFYRPAASRLLIVSVEQTLSPASVEDWDGKDPREIAAAAEACPALHAARKAGWEIVYLALESQRPLTYQKMRGWARVRFGPAAPALPEGPVLGRPDYPDELQTAYRQLLKDLADRFTGPHAAVSASADIAARLHAAEYETYLVGGDAPAGVRRAATWEELGKLLGPK